MLLNNRHGSVDSDAYRYGFNGKEKDDEVKGSGAQYDYGFRIYDPRLGKFLSTDPLFKGFPFYTPYQFAGNKPIWAIDLDGLEERKVTKIRILHNGKEIANGTAVNVAELNGNHTKNVSQGSWRTDNEGYEGGKISYFTEWYDRIDERPSHIHPAGIGNVYKTYVVNRSAIPDSIVAATKPPPPIPVETPDIPSVDMTDMAIKVEKEKPKSKSTPISNEKPVDKSIPEVSTNLLDIPFRKAEAKYVGNGNQARATLNPILDKIKENPLNHIQITVNVQLTAGDTNPNTLIREGSFWSGTQNYTALQLAKDRVARVKRHLRAYQVPESQFDVNHTIDPNRSYQLDAKTTIHN